MTELCFLAVPKPRGEELRVLLQEFNGSNFVNLRQFYQAGPDDMRPSKVGCTVSLASLPALIAGLQRCEEHARESGLIEGDGG